MKAKRTEGKKRPREKEKKKEKKGGGGRNVGRSPGSRRST